MKYTRLVSIFVSCILLVILFVNAITGTAQESVVTHDAIIATIPVIFNLAEQAETTYVGEVDGSYAYIAFVIQDNLAVIYICDGVEIGTWIRAEIVDGTITATAENGIEVIATVTDGSINGMVTMPIDDDGTPPIAHAFETAPAILGETGLARHADEYNIAGWIVTENGIRGLFGKRKERKHDERCAKLNSDWNSYYTIISSTPLGSQANTDAFNAGVAVAATMQAEGCGPTTVTG